MEKIFRESTPKTPLINFDPENGIIELRGKSFPENAATFYTPLIEWIGQYSINPAPVTKIEFELVYFNTGTAKMLLVLINELTSIYKKDQKSMLYWYYSDQDILGFAEDIRENIGIPMILCER